MQLFFYYIAMTGLFLSQMYFAIENIKRDKARKTQADDISYFQVIWNSLFLILMWCWVFSEAYTS